MKIRFKIYFYTFALGIIFSVSLYFINIYFFHAPSLHDIQKYLFETIFFNVFLMLIFIYILMKFVSIEIDKLEKKVTTSSFFPEHSSNVNNQLPSKINFAKESLVKLSHYDTLTSLPNRILFNEILNKALSQAVRHKKILALMIINLDNFKRVNEDYGAEIGDAIIIELSRLFHDILRIGDTISRFSTDEFIILLDNIDNPKFASPVAEKILSICARARLINNHSILISASIGIAIFPNDGSSLEELEAHADNAMYKALHLGGNHYQYYRHEMDIAAREHLKLEQSLRQALIKHEFVLYYQPQLSLIDGTIKSLEALIRWNHPELGLVGPDKFIPLAEETDLIKSIGEWVLHEACKTNKSWQLAGYDPVIVSVNISPKQFIDQNLTFLIRRILEELKLDANYLEIELTESMVTVDMDNFIKKLKEINGLGVCIAIDDFGTGYTSINYLRNLPLSALKIDQTFIKGIPHHQNDVALTSSIIALGHNLGFKIIAEGVETTEQIQFLANEKCDLIQGYFLSRPLPAHKIILQLSRKGKTNEHFLEK